MQLRQLSETLLGGGLPLGEALILLAQMGHGAAQRELALVAAVVFGAPQLHLLFAAPQAGVRIFDALRIHGQFPRMLRTLASSTAPSTGLLM